MDQLATTEDRLAGAGAALAPPAEGVPAAKGSLDAINGRVVEGWAIDPHNPARIVTVEIFDRERRIGETRASQFREDLLEAGMGDGCHAFRFLLPLELFDGREHAIIACCAHSGVVLHHSPLLLRTEDLPVALAFPAPEFVDPTPPLSDLQFTMLRNLHAVSEALIAQSRALEAMLARLAAMPQMQAPAQPAVLQREPPAPPPTPDELIGPKLPEAIRAPRGRHDYVFFSVIDWDFRIQRPQHLASRLAALGNRVFYVSIGFVEPGPHGVPFQLRAQPAEGVFELVLTCRPPHPSIYGGIADPAQLQDIIISLAAAVARLDIRSPVGIVQFPSWFPVAISVPGMMLVHDCLDHVAGFNNIAPRVVALEEEMIAGADCVVVTSEYLAGIVGRRRSSEMVRNGVDTEYFSRPPAALHVPKSRPVIGYYGAIADWFDMTIVLHCARKHPEWRFVLIGATEGADIVEARKLANVEFLGEKPYCELTHYLYAFDVCIIPFKLVELIQATNPVKVYEYLCAGKPVIATDMPEVRRLPEGLVQIARSPVEFERKIAMQLAQAKKSRIEKPAIERRRGWAMQHSWSLRARTLADAVDRHSPRVSVVILCYNNLDFTRACLASLYAFSDYPELEIICVDNASDDGTEGFLREYSERHPGLRIVRNPRNLGFAGGNNVGIRAATGEIVVLLNNDTYVTRGWVRDLIRPLLLDPGIGLTGPLTNMIGNEQKIAINYADMTEMARAASAFVARRRRRMLEVETLAFFCVAIRKDVFAKAGLLDESYTVGFFEDDDFCRSARKSGYRLAICDDVFVHHHLSASFAQLARGEKAELMRKNRKIFEAKWGRWTPHSYRKEPGFGE